jgi:hypothetical protein
MPYCMTYLVLTDRGCIIDSELVELLRVDIVMPGIRMIQVSS